MDVATQAETHYVFLGSTCSSFGGPQPRGATRTGALGAGRRPEWGGRPVVRVFEIRGLSDSQRLIHLPGNPGLRRDNADHSRYSLG